MCRIASLFLLQSLNGSMSGDARAISTTSRRELASIFFFCKAMRRRKFTPFRETLGEHAPSYATVKNWVVQFKHGDFFHL